MTNQIFGQRVSPSGPLLGSPPALVGDGQIDGRCWRAQGVGDPVNIPVRPDPADPNTWLPIPGLDMVPVDFQNLYGYDIAVDIVAGGSDEVSAQSYVIWVLLSLDGVSWVPRFVRNVNCYYVRADGRLHVVAVPQGWGAYKFARVVAYITGREPSQNLTYLPNLAVLTIQEFTVA